MQDCWDSSKVFDYTYDGFRRLSGYGIRDIVNVSYTYKKGYNGQETSLVESLTFGSDVYNYSYDIFGNITSITKNGTTEKTYTYGNASWKDLLTNYNGTNITYDQIGNPNNWHSGMSFTWQNGRQLQGITKGTDSISYTYDADGLRTSKTVNGVTTNYYTIEGTLLAETKGNDTIRYLQDNNGKHYGFIYNGTMYYYTFNLQGDVTGILDSTGVKVVEYTYDIWGKVLSVTGTLADTIGQINPIRYRGYYYDSETGFYYLQSRYYDPEVGRFLNADGYVSTGQGILGYNMFSYCGNNPIIYIDSDGNSPEMYYESYHSYLGAQIGGFFARFLKHKQYQNTGDLFNAKETYNESTVSINNNIPADQALVNVYVMPDYVDENGNKDPTIYIENSYKIETKVEMEAVLDVIILSVDFDETVFKRGKKSWLAEWVGHNDAYFFLDGTPLGDNTAHANLNENEIIWWDLLW